MSFVYLLCADDEMSADDLGRLTASLPYPYRPRDRHFELSLCTDDHAVLRTCPRFDHACCGSAFIATSYRVRRSRFAATALQACLPEERFRTLPVFGASDPVPHLRRCLRATDANRAIVLVASSGTVRRTLARYPAPPAWRDTIARLRHGALVVFELTRRPPAARNGSAPSALELAITSQYLQYLRPIPTAAKPISAPA